MTDRQRWITQAAVDAFVVLVFAMIGRSSHHEALTFGGTVQTAWPFLAGTLLGWLVSRAWRAPQNLFPTGLIVWIGAVVFGMSLRVATGGGFAVAFLIVASLFLALALLGDRAVLKAVYGRRTSQETAK